MLVIETVLCPCALTYLLRTGRQGERAAAVPQTQRNHTCRMAAKRVIGRMPHPTCTTRLNSFRSSKEEEEEEQEQQQQQQMRVGAAALTTGDSRRCLVRQYLIRETP